MTFSPKKSVIFLRYVLASFGVLFLVQTCDLGSPTIAVAFAILFGIYFSNKCLVKDISLKTILAIHFLAYMVFITGLWAIASPIFGTNSPYYDLHPDIIKTEVIFLFALYCLTFIENHLFWKKTYLLSFEVVGLGFILITILSGHRNYKIDIPNTISSLTWKLPILQRFGAEPQQLLVGIGLIFGIIAIFYTILANNRTLHGKNDVINTEGKRRRILELFISGMALIALFYASKSALNRYEAQLSQIMNGVGPSNNMQDGESNLGFNKASNPSRQPAAFVRLQNSYENNPWKPMLYFREGALSTFNGKEIVKSGNTFDTDAPTLKPGVPFRAELLDGKAARERLLQAVYVLSDKITPFGVDSPTQLNPIKNPNPKRFRYAYTILSMAINEPLEDFLDFEVGNPNWSANELAHYLRSPASEDILEGHVNLPDPNAKDPVLAINSGEDLRYMALSQSLTAGLTKPVEKAKRIIDYLSQISIYVLEPGHTLGENGDPVAPYLFADKKRGYCVHYAHAATYLLRLAGIPARIGTGFLVDLQYAKGGDILVQMGDRHAWPEIYIRDRGWIAFDVTPAQAENQEVPIPDESLLEELMSEIDPIEELEDIPPLPETNQDRKSPVEEILNSKIWGYLKYLLPALVLIFFILKLIIRQSWRVTRAKDKKLRRAYISTVSVYEDLGLPRYYGETRKDYANRLFLERNIDFRDLTDSAVGSSYHDKAVVVDLKSSLVKAHKEINNKFVKKLFVKLSVLNPTSLYLIKKIFSKTITPLLILISISFGHQTNVSALPPDSNQLDPELDFSVEGANPTTDSLKDSETLLIEAIQLMREGKSIDARAKLEYALNKNPNDHRPYLFLGQYYLSDVGHFKLAYRYLKQARKLFEKNNSQNYDSLYDLGFQNQHALILYLESEAALSLDFYDESLAILDEYALRYQSEWFPGQKAWVLMKLKRINEAIEVARNGLLEGADPKRTWNILGILLSVSGERELSLQAFARAIQYELSLGGMPQVATPLNNAGEVYREIFKDEFAESAWVKTLKLPDGCEHILPSVNLSILYTDQLRLFQAAQVLSNFQACYALKPERKDTEHRTILALARAKLSLLSNNIEEAKNLAEVAADDQQWFGKIGTNENDVKLAAWVTLAQINHIHAETLRDTVTDSYLETIKNYFLSVKARATTWWLNRRAKIFAVNELDDFEDLFVRHTDTMLTYPLLGSLLNEFDYSALKKRLDRLRETDERAGAKRYYDFFEAKKLENIGRDTDSNEILESILSTIPEHERLLKTEVISTIIKNKLDQGYFFNRKRILLENINLLNELYELLPSRLRYYNFRLPINLEVSPSLNNKYFRIKSEILARRFINSSAEKTNFRLTITAGDSENAFVQLYDKTTNRRIASVEIENENEISEKLNEFITLAFTHRSDPKGLPLPEIPFLK